MPSKKLADDGASTAARTSAPHLGFILSAGFWVVLLFGTARIPWVQQHLLLPFAGFQGRIGCGLFGTPVNSVFVGLSCTGADPMALVVGAIMAFPVAWSRRIKACLGGLALVLVLNTIRIGTLSLVIDKSELFNLLHHYVWPGLLIAVAAGYVFFWMAAAIRAETGASASPRPVRGGPALAPGSPWRFVGLIVSLVGLFYIASGWLFRSVAILEVASWAAATAAAVMSAFGVSAEVTGNTLQTSSGAFMVTQACVVTPLLPVYLAAVLSLSLSPARKALALAAALPLFVFLATARLLVLALPMAVVSWHNIAIHAFYQVLTAVLIVVWVRRGNPGLALAVGAGTALAVGLLTRSLGGAWAGLGDSMHLGHGYVDSQGALSLMPAFQYGFLAALWSALGARFTLRNAAVGAVILMLAQVGVLAVLGELAVHTEIEAPIVAIRALSLGLPIFLVWYFARPSGQRSRFAGEPATERA